MQPERRFPDRPAAWFSTSGPHGSGIMEYSREQSSCLILWAFVRLKQREVQPFEPDEVKRKAEELSAVLVQEAAELGYKFAPITWREVSPEDDWRHVRFVADRDRERWLEDIQRFLEVAIVERGEVPRGWEGFYPRVPLLSREDFADWIGGAVEAVQVNRNLVSAQQSFRNAHRWLEDHNVEGRPDWPTTPDDLHECERLLIQIRALVATGNVKPAAPTDDGKPKKATINARMIDALSKRPEAKDWTVTQWQEHLGGRPGRATIHGTKTWKELEKMRTAAKTTRLDHDSFRDDHGKRKASLR